MKRYALVGAGVRGWLMFGSRLADGRYRDHAEFVGIYDPNMTRAKFVSEKCGVVPIYDTFENMLQNSGADVIIVTTVDCHHHEYIIKAFDAGLEVISEKPMTMDAEKCRAILEAERRTGKKVRVTFNMRYTPYVEKVKELLQSGIIGDVLHADMAWRLDRHHGADYFRRWHGHMEKSGGLLLHKATHHFDAVNWWLGQYPEEIFAYGSRRFYGDSRKEKGTRCRGCEHAKTCGFHWDMASNHICTEMYLKAEHEDGYLRDACVFADDIDIYDSMSLNVKYDGGTIFNYSLIAYSPYEGFDITFDGTKGRMEAGLRFSGMFSQGGTETAGGDGITVFFPEGETVRHTIPAGDGDHGGSDERIFRDIVVGGGEDPLKRKASSEDGAMSLIIGAAANVSIRENRPVTVKELLGR